MKESGKDKESRKLNSLQAIKAVNIPQLPDPRSDNDSVIVSVIVTFEDCDELTLPEILETRESYCRLSLDRDIEANAMVCALF